MHYVTSKNILSTQNRMNIYRGCLHGCIYCDSRSKVYNMNHDFEDIEVKENMINLFKKELLNRNKCMIGLGSMCDPYLPLEKYFKQTRKVLKLINRYGFGFTCITKSDLILRDLDLLRKINEKSKVVIQMTLTTSDEDLCKILEPNVCTTLKRVKVLETLNKEKIPTVVWLSPIIPFINDTEENINSIIDSCINANVKGTLRSGNREYFYKKLDEHFPNLKKKFIEKFSDKYEVTSPNNKKLMKIFKKRTSQHNIMNNPDDIFSYLSYFPKNSIQSKLL